MSLRRVLCVDDSRAVQAYVRSALSGRYAVDTADDGREGLELLLRAPPDAVLLDLSMPRMSGEELLEQMREQPGLREVPVIIVSSEPERARGCLAKGARAHVPKPLHADALVAAVGEVLEEAHRERMSQGLAVLPFRIGAVQAAFPLEAIALATLQPATRPLPRGRGWSHEALVLWGQTVLCVDLARALGAVFVRAPVDRKLLVLRRAGAPVAVCVDALHDPAEVPPERLARREAVAAGDAGVAPRTVLALATVEDRPLAVLDPEVVFSARLLRRLRADLTVASGGPELDR